MIEKPDYKYYWFMIFRLQPIFMARLKDPHKYPIYSRVFHIKTSYSFPSKHVYACNITKYRKLHCSIIN